MIPIDVHRVVEWTWQHIEYVTAVVAALVLIFGAHFGNEWLERRAFKEQKRHRLTLQGIRDDAVKEFKERRDREWSIREKRERRMASPDRQKILSVLIADKVTDFIEDLVHQEKMSREEARGYYRGFSRFLGIPGLLERGTMQLKERLKEKYPDKVMGKVNVIPFPDLNEPVKPTHRLARLRAMRHKL